MDEIFNEDVLINLILSQENNKKDNKHKGFDVIY